MVSAGLPEGIDLFLQHLSHERRVAPNTVAAYDNDLRQFREFVVASARGRGDGQEPGISLVGVDLGTLAGFVFHLRDKGYAQATVARKIAAVKSFFHYAVEAGLVGENPASSLDSPRVRRAAPVAVSPAEVEVLIEAGCAGEGPDALRNRAMLTLLYHSGMRVSEVVGLDVSDVNVGGLTVSCRGRGGRVRVLPLAAAARESVDAYLSRAWPVLARSRGADTSALFLNQRGTRLTRQGFWLIMKERAREAGIDTSITPHTLRHSFALHRLGNGTALRDLKELLGHVNISTTQIYTLVGQEEPAQV